MAGIQNWHHQTWVRPWTSRNCHSLLVTTQMAQPFCKTAWWLLPKVNTPLLFDSTIVLLGIYPKKWKTCVYTKTYMWMFMIVLSIISQSWKQPKCPSGGQYINQLWYSWTMKYYPVLKRNVYFLDLFIGKGCNGESALLVAVITSLEYLPNNFSLLVLKTVCVCVCVWIKCYFGVQAMGKKCWDKIVPMFNNSLFNRNCMFSFRMNVFLGGSVLGHVILRICLVWSLK